jgi:predicted RNase H-like HicB family nuclease
MQLTIRLLRETDGRWIADILELPGVTAQGASAEETVLKAKALALHAIAEQMENGEMKTPINILRFSVGA